MSTDGGASFSLLVGASSGLPEIGNVNTGAAGLAVTDFGDGDTVLAVVDENLYIKSPDADSFRLVGETAGARDVAVTPEGVIYVSTNSGLWTSTDGGSTFDVLPIPSGISTLFTSASEPTALYGIAFREGQGGLHRFDGNTWTQLFDDEYAHGVAVDPDNPNNCLLYTSPSPRDATLSRMPSSA